MFLMNTRSMTVGVATVTLFSAVSLTAPASSVAKEPIRVAAREKTAQPGDVEARITTLHRELKITPDQETAWKDVAQTMRENAKTMAETHSDQTASERTETAPEMIDAYGKTVDMHAAAIRKFGTSFQPLYDSMSAAQKKTADNVFRNKVHEAAKRGKS